MGSPVAPPEATPPGRVRLTGWKDIAAYLGKGLRTAQRWEKGFGLPVHRLGREGGEIVFAFQDEIDQWLRRADGARARNDERAEARRDNRDQAHEDRAAAEAPGGRQDAGVLAESTERTALHGPNQSGAGPAFTRRRARARVRWAAGVLVALAAVVATVVVWPRPGAPSAWRVSGHTLTVQDADGRTVWARRFDAPLHEQAYQAKPGMTNSRVRIVDLDLDGSLETVFARCDDQREHWKFFVFDADGETRFMRRVEATRVYGATTYSSPWAAYYPFITENPGAAPTLWLTHTESQDFPTLLEEVDPQGHPRSEYWSNGFIEALQVARLAGRDLVLVGAANNESGGASLAVFEKGHVNGAAPADRPGYGCQNCPPGAPLAYLVFPRLCLLRTAGFMATLDTIRVDAAGQLTLQVAQDGSWGTRVYYRLDASLRLLSVEISPEFRSEHRRREVAGLVDHAFGEADEEDALRVRRWDGTRFVDAEWAPGAKPPSAATR